MRSRSITTIARRSCIRVGITTSPIWNAAIRSAFADTTAAGGTWPIRLPSRGTYGADHLSSHRHRKPHLPDGRVVVGISANLIASPIPLDDIRHLAIDGADVVVVHVTAEVNVADAPGGDVNALIAPHIAQNGVVVDQQIEVQAVEAQRDCIGIVDADGEIEID